MHEIGLCFFARLMAPFSRLRRVPLRTHVYAHYALSLIFFLVFSRVFPLCVIANGAHASCSN